VANFIGSPSINFLECTYMEKNNRAFLTHEAFRYDVSEYKNQITENASGAELTLGIRPEHIRIVNDSSKTAMGVTIDVVEPLGSETLLDIRLGGDIVRVDVPALVKSKTGDRIFIEFQRSAIHIFDKKTEKAII
jgi:multiple sugar transport system ATP-binding protein